jgi:hypothetical protein
VNPGEGSPERPGESQGVVVISEEREIGPVTSVRPLEPLQRAALWVALGVGVMILLVGAPLAIAWVTGGPPAPKLEGLTPEVAKAVIEQYRALVQIHDEAARARFDEIVLKALLPILTLVLGYVFGSQRNGG